MDLDDLLESVQDSPQKQQSTKVNEFQLKTAQKVAKIDDGEVDDWGDLTTSKKLTEHVVEEQKRQHVDQPTEDDEWGDLATEAVQTNTTLNIPP